MKKFILLITTLFVSSALYAAAGDDLIQQAKTKFAAGNPSEAIEILDNLLLKEPGNLQAKRILADVCVDTGEREYDIKNYKNAYEYFKKAIKTLPTHPIASERYWKMKNDFDVNNLKNEGGSLVTAKPAATPEKETSSGTTEAIANTEKKPVKTDIQVIKKIEKNPRLADELYTKKIYEMEERFNKRLLEVNSQLRKKPETEKETRGLAGFLLMIGTDPKLIAASIAMILFLIIIIIFSSYQLLRFIKKQISSRKGTREYNALFNGETSQNYNELIKMQNIKELLNKIKSGELDWNSIKRSIGEMDRELRLEIFSYIETKTESYQQPLTAGQADILIALMLDGDEYLRKRVASFTTKQLTVHGGQNIRALPYHQGKATGGQPVAQLTYHQPASPEITFLNDLNIVLPLSKIVDRKVFNDNHASRVGVDAYEMAGLLGLSQDECTLYYITGLLHDIGYLDISSDVLNKKATLSEKEFGIIKTHTQRGCDLLDFTEIPQVVKDGILYHHEKWSGEGYPMGLAGDDIPLIARVIGIFDIYEALLLPRPQRPPFSSKEAMRIMKKGSGNIFDPELIKIFEKMVKENLVSRENIWKN